MYIWLGISFALIIWGIIKDKSKIALVFILLFLFVCMAYNRDTYDYNNYATHYYEFSHGLNWGVEPLFRLVFRSGAAIFPSYDQFKVVLTALQLFFLFFTVRAKTDSVAMVFALYLIYPAYLDGFHTRFFMASLIVFFAIQKYVLDISLKRAYVKSSILYVLFIVLASLIHNALAVFAFVIVIPLLKRNDKMRYRKVIAYTVLIMFLFLVLRYSGILYGITSRFLSEARVGSYSENIAVSLNREQINIIILYSFRQFLRIAFSFYLIKIYSRIKNHYMKEKKEEQKITPSKYLDFLVMFNCVALVIVVFQTYSINFERLYRIIDLMNYVGAAICIRYCMPCRRSRWKIKLAAIAYATFFAVAYYFQSEVYTDIYRTVFINNVLFN